MSYFDKIIPDSTDGRRGDSQQATKENFNTRNGSVWGGVGSMGDSDYTELKEIRDHHKEIVNLLATGVRPFQIAKELKLSNQTVVRVSNNPIIREMVGILQDERADNAADIAASLARLAPKAIELLEEVINYRAKVTIDDEGLMIEDPDSMLMGMPKLDDQRKAATDLLKIVIPKTQIERRSQYLSGSMIDQIKQNCLQAEAEEASYEEVS